MHKIDPLPLFEAHPFARDILDRLTEKGRQAVIVGGAVRDALKSQFEPDFKFNPRDLDVDIATDAPVKEIKNLLTDNKLIEIGAQFGVVIVVGPHGNQYEVARYRTEKDYDGRKPLTVQPAPSLKADVKRRDFTVNGLAMEIDGTVLDYVGGIEDLKTNTIRAIGDPYRRFEEDYLRLIRAIRFSCVLGGQIEKQTFEALKETSSKIREISWERIGDEFLKILDSPNSGSGIELMDETGLLREVIPELVDCKGVAQPEKYHPEGDVYNHSLGSLKMGDKLNFNPLIKLSILLHDMGKKEALRQSNGEHTGGHEEIGARKAEKICKRLRLSNKKTRLVRWLIKNHMRGAKLPLMSTAKQVNLIRANQRETHPVEQIADRYPYFTALVQLIIADSQASVHRSRGWLPVVSQTAKLIPHLRDLERQQDAREMIDGNDLLDLGLEEGPQVGRLLAEIHRKIYGGEIRSREEALDEAKQLVEIELDGE